MKEKENGVALNLLDLTPHRNHRWETDGDNAVVVLVPKFRNRLLVSWLLPRLRSQHFRVKLDAFGSHVWLNCDGSKTVHAIGQSLKKRFGNSVEPVYDRLGVFIKRLQSERFIQLTEKNDRAMDQ
ncbi:MAG: PqqD family protein [Gemmatimonadota bacterium]|nr:MAG: PqqD family protein [Gemmatimonadota bacterium]